MAGYVHFNNIELLEVIPPAIRAMPNLAIFKKQTYS